ncbi:unnamed protein product [Blepharisma stoltei]|uniref:Translin-associated factor X-interacting protein 1 N-terminal domain-containing protein n=1 Tax=Blepharisma stoltei TaxID=1481888 RepID=A0AAU9K4M7_9CILI|nr:unnamed protein product [Blepharisma stoltei]
MSIYKTFSQSLKISPQTSPENPVLHRNHSPFNFHISPSAITLPKHKKNVLSTTSPYEAPLLIKKNHPKIHKKINSEFSKSFTLSKLSNSNHSLNTSTITPDLYFNQRGDTTDSTLSSIDKNREISSLECRLIEKIKNNSPISHGKFKVYQEIWNELLMFSNPLTKILVNIKKGYEEWIEYQAKELQNKAELASQLEQERISVKLFSKRFKKLARENLELTTALKDKDITIGELSEHIKMLLKNNKKIKIKARKDIENLNKQLQSDREEINKNKQKIIELTENLQYYKNLLRNKRTSSIVLDEPTDNDISRKSSNQSMNSSSADAMHRPLTISLSLETLNESDKGGSDLVYSPSADRSPCFKESDTRISDETPFRDLNSAETPFHDSNSSENCPFPIAKK